jgi:outer membrane protein assembly factor BamA
VLFSCNYTWERDHITDPGDAVAPGIETAANPGLDTAFNLGYLTAALTYDQRNSIVNPMRGFFLSGSLLVARKFLGSGVDFSRFYGESHWYIPVSRFLVMASPVRAGAGRGLGQENLPAERFFAGGGNTLRGFSESMVGPIDEKGNPLGGEALFIFKQELRARLNGLFSIVLFADFGNVYSTSGEFDFFNVRKSAGFGVRVDTGPLLLRFDWGFKLDRRHGESPSQIFFSIGQSF